MAVSAINIVAFANKNTADSRFKEFCEQADSLSKPDVSLKEIQEFYKEYEKEINTVICDPVQAERDAIAINVDPEPIIGDVSNNTNIMLS